MKGKLLFLGSGSSAGVPEIGCSCSVCLSSFEKNKRLRPSCLVEVANKILLIDVSPDFRYQALKYNIQHIDGLLLTHAHYDHIGGLDDLRKFTLIEKKPIDCLLSKDTLQEIKKSFHYLFEPPSINSSLSVKMRFSVLESDFGNTLFQALSLGYVSYFQKLTKITGYKIGNLAYISDIKEYDETLFNYLRDIDVLIISALRKKASPVHFGIDDAIAFAKRVNPKQTYFTHIAHEVDHEKTSAILPPKIFLAYDGLQLEFNYER